MNKFKYIITSLLLVLVFSCTNEDYLELNRDPNNPTLVSADALFTSSVVSLFDQMESTNVNLNVFRLMAQYWTETTYTDETNYDLNNRSIPDNHWSEIYRDVLYDLKDAKAQLAGSTDATTNNKLAQIGIIEVYAWQILVDTFGDIPFTEAIEANNIPSPTYDDDSQIYATLLTMVNDALANISTGSTGFATDVIYNGNMAAWEKFGNSLKLKLAMRMVDANPTVASAAAIAAVNAGVFTSNADNCTIAYESATPNTNPLWVSLVQSGRNDFVPAETITDYMNGLSDPRRSIYFDQNLGPGVYNGGVYGDNNTYAAYTHIGTALLDPTFRGVLLDYSEVEFMLAEAVEQGIAVGGTAADHYEDGITASMEDWGVAGAAITTYLARADVDYGTAPGTWRQKIGLQYWLAMYNRGFEGWYVYRKFDAPTMNVAALSGLPVPKRYTYPLDEQTLNKANYDAASAAIGGDMQQTPIFWDMF